MIYDHNALRVIADCNEYFNSKTLKSSQAKWDIALTESCKVSLNKVQSPECNRLCVFRL